jgi:hypothetical protein
MDSVPTGSCVSAAISYLRRFGWPCVADGHAVWTLAGQAFDAVDVPAKLGPALLARLGDRADVIEIPGNLAVRWRVLVSVEKYTPHRVRADLARHGAVHLTTVDRVELPPTRVRGGELRWVREPAGRLTALSELMMALCG